MRNASIRQDLKHKLSAEANFVPSLRALFDPLDRLLASGGDARLQLSPLERLNGYGCRPSPRPEAFTFASSTATSISARAYARAGRARDELIEASLTRGVDNAVDTRVEQMRDELKTHLQLESTGTEIVFSPSGTDSQLHALFIARSLLGTPLVNVIAAADQTGRGTVHTARGCHFADRSAQGAIVEIGMPIAGMAAGVTSIGIPLHDENGIARATDALDRMIVNAVSAAIDSGSKVLLQVMDSSKLGLRSPSQSCVQEICTRWAGSVQIIVDACQMRLSRARIKHYLNCGHMILLTGSKFFTGPPFSGALLVPAKLSRRLADVSDVPQGLCDYTNRSDWPQSWPAIRAQLPTSPNFGQWLRWEAALEEIRAYYSAPVSFRRSALTRFAGGVTKILASSPNLELFPTAHDEAHDGIDDDEMSVKTIFPFAIRHNGNLLQFDDCTKIYRALNRDASNLLSENITDCALAAQLCHIGQPVALRLGGAAMAVLRISAGARVVSETWSEDDDIANLNVQREIDQVATICEKVEFLVGHLDELS